MTNVVAPDAEHRSNVLRRALVELKAARAEVAEARRLVNEPIAVVGMGCRFPGGATGIEKFWDLLVSGRSGVVEVPADRWDLEDFFDPDPDAAGRTYARHGGFVDGIREFDAGLFGIPPREAVGVDPQHRLVLEVAWEALEHAGIAPDSLRGTRTGVFVGMGGSDFERLKLSTGDVSAVDGHSATGGALNMAANRLSFALGLEGPSLVVDTACSSSLVALHLACQALRSGECDTALVAGVNTLLSPGTTVALSKGRMLSPEGRCKTFDATADGYVRGEGCGVVVLRRADVAREAGQRIWAVVRGSATNQDGRSSGLTVPRADAQQEVIRRALAAGDVRPADVGYVEAHGTGTALGDPIEVRALAAVLGDGRAEAGTGPVALGSVKTNIGHLEAAAGIAGLIKTVLVLDRGLIPPHLNLTRPSPHIAWAELPVTVPTTATPWADGRRVAGVSSFGFGGTNAHVVLESPPPPEPAGPPRPAAPVLVKVTGQGAEALRAGAERLAAWARDAESDVATLAWAAGTGRADLSDRAAVVAETLGEAAELLDAVAAGRPAPGVVQGRRRSEGPPRVALVVPAAGALPVGLLAALHRRTPAVAEVVDEMAEALGPAAEASLGALLGGTDDGPGQGAPTAGDLVRYVTSVALGRWWRSIGVRPDLVVGRGTGAFAAATLAGVWSPADGARLVSALAAGEPLDSVLDKVGLRAPGTELLLDTDLTGDGAEVATAGYWLRRAGDPAPAAETVRAVLERRVQAVVELGSAELGPGFLAATDEQDMLAVAAPAAASDAPLPGLLEAAGRLWAAGASLDWAQVNGPRPAHPPLLPTYPFQRRTFWPGADPRASLARAAHPAGGTGLRPRVLGTATGVTVGETELSLRQVPFLAEHRVHGRLVVPGVIFLELVLRCAEHAFGGPARAQDLSVSRPLVLGDEDTATVQVVIDPPTAGRARARLFSGSHATGWRLHFETVLDGGELAAEPPAGAVAEESFAAGAARCHRAIGEDEFYRRAWHPMFRLGPSFRLVRGARTGPGAAVGTLVRPAPDAAGVVAGVRPELLLLDACIQLVAVAALSGEGFTDRPVHLGTGYQRMSVGDVGAASELECAAVLRESADGSVLGDLRLTDAEGRLVAEIWGASFRPVTERMLQRMVAGPAAADGPPAASDVPAGPDVAELRAAEEPARSRLVVDLLTHGLARVLGARPAEIDPRAPVETLADSLMIAELRTDIERRLGVTVPMEAFFADATLTTLARYVTEEWATEAPPAAPTPEAAPAPARKAAGPAAKAPAPRPARPSRVTFMSVPEMTELAELDASITVTGPPEPWERTSGATLLTGATGFVGGFLLAELLNRRPGDVHCLVRASDPAHAMRRLTDNLRSYGVDPTPHLSRIVPVVGDLAKPRFGLDEARFAALHDGIGDIVHCGGMVKWTYPYQGLQGANVAGTREVLRLATLGAPRPVHFISTVGVFSSRDFTADVVYETDDMHTSGSLVVGYAQTKWVSERMVRFAHERGLPVTIHRINTGGHSVTGAFNRLDHLTLILKGCVQAGIAPHSVAVMPVQPAPIDYVASAVVEVAKRPELLGGTFHLVNERALTWKELFDAVETFGYPLERVPFEDWRRQVTGRNPGTLALLGLAPFLHDSLEHTRLPFSDSELTRRALAGADLSCPPLDDALVHTFLRGFVEAGFLEPPAGARRTTPRPEGSDS
ncbi:thioester reductase domain-containing protein [Streptomyces millisiae]|uniref:Thioester reductase domain-containing protein n=1 Tax=Streptomyces millisiae TaxID=3075542 RepID=A0ABU2LIT8_9ACTN|nr:thioester reductase domain-containing protein [Streptomyces sp. DSM 44918]MDT0317187.1 thioester reductase domain-containing protein [Streptomyces sp. DSM 44918]